MVKQRMQVPRENESTENDGEIAGMSGGGAGAEVSETENKSGELEIKSTNVDISEKQLESSIASGMNSMRETEPDKIEGEDSRVVKMRGRVYW